MKAKKIISLISAIAMCVSFAVTSVSAAMEVGSEDSLITGIPTEAEVAARTPEITLTAVKAESKQDIIDAGVASLAANAYFSGYDAYVVTMTVTNVGDLACGYKAGNYDDADKAGLVVPAVVLSFTNDTNIQKYVIGSMSFSSAKSIGIQGTLNAIFGSATEMGYSYPTFDANTLMGQKLANPTLTAKLVLSVTQGKSVNLVTEDATVTYVLGDGTVGTAIPVSVDVDTITLGESEPVVETKTVGFASTVDYVAGKTGVEFAITTDDSAVTTKTKTVKVPFGTVIESKTTGIKMGVNVTGVPSTVSLTSTAALY